MPNQFQRKTFFILLVCVNFVYCGGSGKKAAAGGGATDVSFADKTVVRKGANNTSVPDPEAAKKAKEEAERLAKEQAEAAKKAQEEADAKAEAEKQPSLVKRLSPWDTLQTTPIYLPVAAAKPAGGNTPAGNTPAGNTPAGNTPAGNTPAGNTPAGNTPAGNTPAGNTPAGNTPAGNTPAGNTPAGNTPAGNTPAGNTPAGNTPAGNTPAGNTPAGNTPAGNTPAGNTPAGNTPAGNTPAGNTPAGNTPAGNTPAGNTPAGNTPAGNTPAGNTPAGNTPAGNTPAGNTPAPVATVTNPYANDPIIAAAFESYKNAGGKFDYAGLTTILTSDKVKPGDSDLVLDGYVQAIADRNSGIPEAERLNGIFKFAKNADMIAAMKKQLEFPAAVADASPEAEKIAVPFLFAYQTYNALHGTNFTVDQTTTVYHSAGNEIVALARINLSDRSGDLAGLTDPEKKLVTATNEIWSAYTSAGTRLPIQPEVIGFSDVTQPKKRAEKNAQFIHSVAPEFSSTVLGENGTLPLRGDKPDHERNNRVEFVIFKKPLKTPA